MNRTILSIAALFVSTMAVADNVEDSDKILCSANQVMLCVEGLECFNVPPEEMGTPQFLVADLKKKILSTTKASQLNRSSPVDHLLRDAGLIVMQGKENERVFSIVIDEATGILTASVATDGFTLSVFGACTDLNQI